MKKVIIGFIAGVTVGMLYAPVKGKDARRKLASVGGSMKEGWDTLTDSVSARMKTEAEEKYDRYSYDSPDMML